MDKPLNSIPNRPAKHSRNPRKQQPPLKVVYITNPIKFTTSASEFRALVQELTGRDAAYPPESGFPVVAAAEISNNAHAVADEEPVVDVEFKGGRVGGSDPLMGIGSGMGTDEWLHSVEKNLIQDVLQSFGS